MKEEALIREVLAIAKTTDLREADVAVFCYISVPAWRDAKARGIKSRLVRSRLERFVELNSNAKRRGELRPVE